MTVSANITGGGSSFLKSGVGALYLTGSNSYGSTTWINSGTLVNDGTISNTSGVIIQQGATLAGTGSVTSGSGYTVYGALAPGNPGSIGTLTLGLNSGALNFLAGSSLAFDISGATSDTLKFTGVGDWLAGSGNATLALNASGVQTDTPYVVFQNVSTSGFTFADISGTPVGYTPTLTFTGADGGAFGAEYADDYVLTFTETPEPSTYAMMLGGLVLLGFCVRRRVACG